MWRSRGLPALAAGLLLIACPAAAAADGQCLAFTEGLLLAAERAPEVEGARARQDQAAATLREAQSLRWPQLSTFARSGVGDSGLTGNQVDNQFGFRVSQRLWDFGDARLAREAARNELHQQIYGVWAQQMQMSNIVAEAYIARLEADAMINVISDRRDYFQRQHDAVEALLARGGATRAESAQIAAQLAEADAEVLELRFLAQRASTRVNEYTGLQTELCDAGAAGRDMEFHLAGLATAEDIIDAALAHNPNISARRSAIASLEAQRARQRRSRLPEVTVVGISSYVYDDFREEWEYRDRVGLDVSMPILTGDRLGAQRARAEALLAQEESGLRALQRGVREEAEITFRRMISLEAQLVRRRAVADSQQAYFEAIAGEFEFGLGTLPDLVEARLAYERALLDLVSTEFALLRQKLALMQLAARMPLPDRDRPALP